MTVLRARVVLPVSRPPISDGAVCVSGNRIASVGPWSELSTAQKNSAVDLGETILLPGLVNAHCHLDYTAMAGKLPTPAGFVNWLQNITGAKINWIYSHYAQSWISGAKMLVRTGTTTVGDIEMIPELLPEVWTATPLRVLSLIEMTGVRSRRPPAEIIAEALEKVAIATHERCRIGFSPHAPYSTTPELLQRAARSSRKYRLPMATHVSESSDEFEMFTRGSGPMFKWLSRSGRDMSDCALGSPIQHLARHDLLGSNLLAVHVNYLAPGDVALLARNKVSVVHCPRSHAYFGHRAFPFHELADAGVNICLGTDSLASVTQQRKEPLELNLFAEMRQFAGVFPDVPARTIVKMATVSAAAALGMKRDAGRLASKTFADVIAIPFSGKIEDAFNAVLDHRGDVAASMIDGQWAVPPSV